MQKRYQQVSEFRDLADKFKNVDASSVWSIWSENMMEIADGYAQVLDQLSRYVPRRSDLSIDQHDWGCKLSANLGRFHDAAITGSFEFMALTSAPEAGRIEARPVSIVVLEGSGIITLTEGYKPQEIKVSPGSLVDVPAEVEHKISPDWNSRLLVLRFERG